MKLLLGIGNELGAWASTAPIVWLGVTILIWLAAVRLAAALGNFPLANPLLVTITAVSIALSATSTSYELYFSANQPIHLLLGPAAIALAVPMVRHWRFVTGNAVPIVFAMMAGCTTSVLTTVILARGLGLPRDVTLALAPHSITTSIAIPLVERTGGSITLVPLMTIGTGILGAILWPMVMYVVGVKDHAAGGLAAGLAATGAGTARAFELSGVAGTFAGIAVCLNGIATAVLMPYLMQLASLVESQMRHSAKTIGIIMF